jgi:integrase
MNTRSNHQPAPYTKVLDGRKQPVRGLWKRNERFYAQLTFEDASTGKKEVRRVALVDQTSKQPVATVAEAIKALERLKTQREDNALPILKRTPKLTEAAEAYFASLKKLTGAKTASTIAKEKGALEIWKKAIGHVHVDKITKAMINRVREDRQAAGMSARTVNLDLIALRNVLKYSRDNDWLRALPYVKPLPSKAKVRPFYSATEIDQICASARQVSKNGAEFTDYVQLMASCGSRRDETLRLKWTHVSFENEQLTIGADGLSKNHEARQVDFNPKLKALLKEMYKRRAPDSEYLFPSPQRGDKDRSAKTFKDTLNAARVHAVEKSENKKLTKFGFHDCRHYFISMCVMSGVDFMTIAKWVGHKDGGVLIGKVYGHLADDHRKRMAQQVKFSPEIVPSAKGPANSTSVCI